MVDCLIENQKQKAMRSILILASFVIFTSTVFTQEKFHDFEVKDIYGDDFKLLSLKGKKVLVVNTASKCGLTPQYEDLEKLYKEYKDKGLVIIGFPANNFMKQEPGTNEEIITFCEANYGVTFPMMSKINVKGNDIHPLYKWLTKKDLNGVKDSKVAWNFQKYLIDEEGNFVDVVQPKEKPHSETILNWLKGEE